MSLRAFQRALVALYSGRKLNKLRPGPGLTAAERRALEGIDPKALARYQRGLRLKKGR